MFYAHTKDGFPETDWQKLTDHLNNVAIIAARFADSFGVASWGKLVGSLHDLGKYSEAFQKRIRGENIKVDHSTPGAKYVDNNFNTITDIRGAGRLMAYCIAGHHTGLPDGISGEDDSCLFKRLEKCETSYESYVKGIGTLSQPAFYRMKTNKQFGFSAAFFTRMIYSCLVDADYLDTEAFMDPQRSVRRKKTKQFSEFLPILDKHLRELLSKAIDSNVNKLRARVLDECLKASEQEPGLFSLTVPTGGGKTLSSLAFAINHAIKHNLSRIIYVIPYTNIIEQTAGIFKKIFGSDSVLEHHSNIVVEKNTIDEEAEENRRLASENWDASIIVTTNVQFFESFYSNRSSKTRKLHNITRSVVILDEAQMLPVPFLRPTIEIIREMAEYYNTSFVLCTATQPALNERDDFKGGLSGVREIMSNPKFLEHSLERVKTFFLGQQSDEDIIEKLSKENRVLCIVNTKKQAKLLFQALKEVDSIFHLSAAMCPAHRRAVLETIRKKLKHGKDCRVISTQLVEAGVDLDFPVVFRAMAGIDSIVQAAGRCNREGLLEEGGRLYVFESEYGIPPGYLRQNAQVAELVLKGRENKLISSETVEAFFKELYWLKDSSGDLDTKDILKKINQGASKGDFPFKSIASEYNLIGDVQESVIVPYDDEAGELCRSLKYGFSACWSVGGILRKLQPYTIQVYPKQLAALIQVGWIETIDDRYFILTSIGRKEIYDEHFGLNPDIKEFIEVEHLII